MNVMELRDLCSLPLRSSAVLQEASGAQRLVRSVLLVDRATRDARKPDNLYLKLIDPGVARGDGGVKVLSLMSCDQHFVVLPMRLLLVLTMKSLNLLRMLLFNLLHLTCHLSCDDLSIVFLHLEHRGHPGDNGRLDREFSLSEAAAFLHLRNLEMV